MSSHNQSVPVRILNNAAPAADIQVFQYEYIPSGYYYIPQVVPEVTPYNYTYFNHCQAYCTTASYVTDCVGRVNYPSDFEYQMQVGTSIQPQQREMIYSYYDDGEREISLLPHIEDDISEEPKVRVRKRKHSKDEYELDNSASPALKKCYRNELNGSSVYRAREGYLVEEPSENDSLNV